MEEQSYSGTKRKLETKREIWNVIIDLFNCGEDSEGKLLFFIKNPQTRVLKIEFYDYIENALLEVNLKLSEGNSVEEIMAPIIYRNLEQFAAKHAELLINFIWYLSAIRRFINHKELFGEISSNLQRIISLYGREMFYNEERKIWKTKQKKTNHSKYYTYH